MFNDAAVAGPPSPAYPFSPLPAIVVMRRARRSRRRIRWLSRSQKYMAPSGPKITPYGLLTCASEKPPAPVPTSVDTTDAARARVARSANRNDCNRLRRVMFTSDLRLTPLLETLARFVDIAMKNEQAIAVRGGRVAELVTLAFQALHLQRLRQIIHFEHVEIGQRQRKPIAFVVAVIAKSLRRCGQPTLARPQAMFMNDI